jgi:hypothetical protein
MIDISIQSVPCERWTDLTFFKCRASTTYTKANMFEFVTEADGRRYHRYRQGSKYYLLQTEVENRAKLVDFSVYRISATER